MGGGGHRRAIGVSGPRARGLAMEGNSSKSAVSIAVRPGWFGDGTARPTAVHGSSSRLSLFESNEGSGDNARSNDLLGLPLTVVSRAAATAILQSLAALPAATARWVCFLNPHNF